MKGGLGNLAAAGLDQLAAIIKNRLSGAAIACGYAQLAASCSGAFLPPG